MRKLEISDLILIAEKEENLVLLKSLILLLYSHWEGYIKKSSKTYLKFIAENKFKLCDLTDNFRAVALKGISKADSQRIVNELNKYLIQPPDTDYTDRKSVV